MFAIIGYFALAVAVLSVVTGLLMQERKWYFHAAVLVCIGSAYFLVPADYESQVLGLAGELLRRLLPGVVGGLVGFTIVSVAFWVMRKARANP